MVEDYKNHLDNAMKREVSRGEFLRIIGVIILGVVGITGLLKNIHAAVPAANMAKKHSAGSGYGRSAYGQ